MVRTGIAIGLVAAGGLLLATQLHADPKGDSQPTSDADRADANKLTPKELQARGDKMVVQLNDHLQHAQVAQARARKAKDVLKLNCVNDGLLVTKQILNVGDDARAKLDRAIQGSDHAEQVAQFNNLASAVATAEQSKQSIDGCIGGSEVTIVGPNGSKVTIVSPNVRDNPTHDCDNLGLIACASQPLEYVGYASPFTTQ